jgi:small GTP-binding protein
MKKVRICLVGDPCGKTALVDRWCNPNDTINPQKTIAIEMRTTTTLVDNEPVTISMWDCSGDRGFRHMLSNYIKNAGLAVVCFDLTEALTWLTAQYWVEQVIGLAADIPICLIGTKLDQESKRVIRDTVVQQYIRSVDRMIFYCETSSYTGENCRETLKMIARESFRDSKVYTPIDFKKEKTCILM